MALLDAMLAQRQVLVVVFYRAHFLFACHPCRHWMALELPDQNLLERLAVAGCFVVRTAESGKAILQQDQRLALHTARAAFSLVNWHARGSPKSELPCIRCGLVRTNLCGSCHPRRFPANLPPLPFRHGCDEANIICPKCETAGVMAERRAEWFAATYPRVVAGQTAAIYGTEKDGVWTRFHTPREVPWPQGVTLQSGFQQHGPTTKRCWGEQQWRSDRTATGA